MKPAAALWASLLLGSAASFSHSGLLFTEDFEEGSVGELTARWSNVKNPEMISFSSDIPLGSDGSQSIMMRHIAGQNTGAHLYRDFSVGYDTLYAQFQVKFSATHAPVHHLVKLGGYNPPSPWPLGNAGELPNGSDNFITGLEPGGSAWSWQNYTYWMHMRGDTISGYWGNVFHPSPSAPAPRDSWMLVEMMLTCNNPVTSWNGEQAFWIDGEKAIHLGEGFPNGSWSGGHYYVDGGGLPFEGFQWRSTGDLQLTFFWLSYYMTGGGSGVVDTVWFDDVVVSTEPIGVPSGLIGTIPERPFDSVYANPNPFGPGTDIHYHLRTPSSVSLDVFDVRGRLIRSVERAVRKSAGNQRTRWDGFDDHGDRVAPGIYFCAVEVGKSRRTSKLVLIR